MNRPIGVFDSGVGGITVVKEIIRQLPNETIYFFGDVKNCPYGDKSQQEILKYTEKAVKFLISKDVKMIVLACNTATAASLDYLEGKYNIPIIGVIKPGARTAIQATNNKKVLVLGTNFTAKSKAYTKEIHNINKNIIVHNKACITFVSFVEKENYNDKEKVFKLLNNELLETKNLDIDTIILGCTHYPILQKDIESYYKNKIKVISSGIETAREVSMILTFLKIHNKKEKEDHKFFISKDSNEFKKTANKWLNENICIEVVEL
ncbi:MULTISPECIES: glutamate racemase [unclassified Gemella]|uniref:glutamate racemase n=1 Tax=unclassified Gemella TaxID=2624949 RepID=UPI001C051DA3|nr:MULTISPECIES: glutamate racemase [unclassified Gemella]MBU0278538.1 glutamate racemase [Gemella sp. zg-1178]QWQ39427.1 glutamate racemase [Gemella sp. zg-570]